MAIDTRVAVISGATSGIGAATARRLAADGAAVVVAGRHRDRGTAVAEAIQADGGRARFVAHDLLDPDSPARVVEAAEREYGSLDILVNAAGVFQAGPFSGLTATQIDEAFAENVRGAMLLTQAAVPGMASRGHGRVVFLGTIFAHVGLAVTALYGATKASLEGLASNLTVEFGSSGITFNVVAPGVTDTPMAAAFLATPEARAQVASASPDGRVGTPEDVAAAIRWVIDDDAGHLGGAVVPVDGGQMRA